MIHGPNINPASSTIEISHIPPLLRVHTFVGTQLPPSIFIIAPPVPAADGELQMNIEQFVHLAILPKELQATVRQEVSMTIYRRLESDLRRVRSANIPLNLDLIGEIKPEQTTESRIIDRMAAVLSTLSDENRQIIKKELYK